MNENDAWCNAGTSATATGDGCTIGSNLAGICGFANEDVAWCASRLTPNQCGGGGDPGQWCLAGTDGQDAPACQTGGLDT